jgi:hypothetical protein
MDEQAGHLKTDAWDSGSACEPYVDRWSGLVARKFLEWLAVRPRIRLAVQGGADIPERDSQRTAKPRENARIHD